MNKKTLSFEIFDYNVLTLNSIKEDADPTITCCNILYVSLSISIVCAFFINSDSFGSVLEFFSFSCNFKDIPRIEPLFTLLVKCVTYPAILFLKFLEGISAISSQNFLLT